jgi:hypothetical protein
MSSRRGFLAAAGGTMLAAPLLGACTAQDHSGHSPGPVEPSGGHGPMSGVRGATFRSGGRVDHAANGFDPRILLRDFDYGHRPVNPRPPGMRRQRRADDSTLQEELVLRRLD